MKMLIGIMGKSGSGKSTITRIINSDNRYQVTDVDEINHMVIDTEEFTGIIRKKYPRAIENGQVNRHKLASILYEDKDKMQEYNELIWSYTSRILEKMISESQKDTIIDWMMLPLTKFYRMCDYKILVDCSTETRRKRIEERDLVPKEHFYARDKNAVEYNRDDFDLIINNEVGVNVDEIKGIGKRIALLREKR